jgi:hypothetical protein
MDGLMMDWRRLLLVRCRPDESLVRLAIIKSARARLDAFDGDVRLGKACLEALQELLLVVELPELERIWLKHDFGCVLFEVCALICSVTQGLNPCDLS